MSEKPPGHPGEGLRLLLVAGLLLLNVGLVVRQRHVSVSRHQQLQAIAEQVGAHASGTPVLWQRPLWQPLKP